MSNTDQYLSPEQLCIGLYIHLDLAWMDHPFTFSSFKIKDDEQLEKVRRLGLKQIRYSPDKSDLAPLVPAAVADPAPTPQPLPLPPQEDEVAVAAKRARIAKLEAHRQAMVQCEKAFGSAAQTVRSLEKNIHARPKEAVAAADQLVDGMLDSLLTDKDIAIHLMSDRTAGEDIYYHSLNVSVLSLTLAKELKLSRGDIHILGLAALLHDVGKREVPDKILLKTDTLTRAEQSILEQHVQWSLQAAQNAGLVGPVLDVIAQHHEMCDGSGYPARLKQAAIHPVARVLGLINVFDNLCNAANPAQSMTPHEALAYMFAQQRNKYDGQTMSTFIRCMGVYPPGSVVMLSNDAFALVVSVNSSRPLKPQVLVYEPDVPREEAVVIDLEEESDLNISKALKPNQLPRAAAEYLNPRKRQTYYFDAKEKMKPSPEKLLDACAEAVLAVDPQTLQILAANREAGVLLGLPTQELLGRMISEFEVGLQDLCFWDEVRAGNVQNYLAVEGEYRRHGGTLLAVRKSVRLLEEEGCYVVSVHDISAQRQIEEQTALANSLLMATLESTVDGILVTDTGGSVQHCNRQFCQQWRLPDLAQRTGPASQVFEQILESLLDPQAMQAWLENLFAEPLLDGRIECRLLDGRVFEVASLPQRYKDWPIGRVFGFHDISKLKAAEAQLIAARDAAQAANRAKSEFLSHMSHELRTPLNAMLGFSQVLEDELEPPNRMLVEYISKAGRHLLDLINEVLDLSSIEAGKLHLNLESIDLAAVVDDAVSLLQPLAANKPVTLMSQVGERGCFLVMADARRLRQMLLNLISNAIKYNRSHGRVEVTVVQAMPEYWRLMVTDTGVGITEEEQKQLFQPFTRVGQQQSQIEGTGIGLAFTRKLARLMHGQIGFKSETGVGSCFWIDLPCASRADETQADSGGAAIGSRVLYIEDDPLSQKLLATVMVRRRPDLQLDLAGLGEEGIAIAQQKSPALILLDQNLPDMSGAEIFKRLRSQAATASIPVFALSGNVADEDREAALASGYLRYLTKPIQVDDVLAAISAVLPLRDGPAPN